MWQIYGLKDPRTNEIRYIGRTRYPERRLAFHLYSPTNPELGLWLAELQQENLKPYMEILETLGESVAEAEYQEVYWIQKYAGKKLLNIQYNNKNLRRFRPRRRSVKLELPAALVERAEAEAHELGMHLSNYIAMRLSGYVSQPLPEVQ